MPVCWGYKGVIGITSEFQRVAVCVRDRRGLYGLGVYCPKKDGIRAKYDLYNPVHPDTFLAPHAFNPPVQVV